MLASGCTCKSTFILFIQSQLIITNTLANDLFTSSMLITNDVFQGKLQSGLVSQLENTQLHRQFDDGRGHVGHPACCTF